MAIARDTSNTAQTNTATSLTFAHTCTGSNVVLFVGFSLSANNAPTVTYNGNNMTQVDVQLAASANTYLFYILIGAADGLSHNVVISTGASSQIITASSVSYTGALQSASVIDAHNKAAATSVALTVVGTRCWIVATSGASIGGGVTYSAGAGFTLLQQANQGGDMNGTEDSNGIVSSGSNTVAFSTSAGSPSTVIAASIAVQPTVNTMTALVGTFALTGFNTTLSHAKSITAAVGSFLLTGYATTLSIIRNKWSNTKKDTSSWTNQNKS